MLNVLIYILLAVFVVVCLLLILLVLMQRPKSEGLGAAFGGGMTENLFGAQTTNVLQKFTRYLGAIFFALTLTLAVLYAKQSKREASDELSKRLLKEPSAAVSGTGAIPAVSGTVTTPAVSGSAAPTPAAPEPASSGTASAPAAAPEPAPAEAPAPASAGGTSAASGTGQ
jgi:preprotein translocase subunit SecG